MFPIPSARRRRRTSPRCRRRAPSRRPDRRPSRLHAGPDGFDDAGHLAARRERRRRLELVLPLHDEEIREVNPHAGPRRALPATGFGSGTSSTLSASTGRRRGRRGLSSSNHLGMGCALARARTRRSYWPDLSLGKSPPMLESSHSFEVDREPLVGRHIDDEPRTLRRAEGVVAVVAALDVDGHRVVARGDGVVVDGRRIFRAEGRRRRPHDAVVERHAQAGDAPVVAAWSRGRSRCASERACR